MKINSLKLENIGKFDNLLIEKIPSSAKLIVIIGENGSGKSSILDSLALLENKPQSGINLAANKTDENIILEIPANNGYISKFDINKTSLIKIEPEKVDKSLTPQIYFQPARRGFSYNSDIHSAQDDTNKTNPHFINSRNEAPSLQWSFNKYLVKIRSEIFSPDAPNKAYDIITEKLQELNNLFASIIPNSPKFNYDSNSSRISMNSKSGEVGQHFLSDGEKSIISLLVDLFIETKIIKNSKDLFIFDEIEARLNPKIQSAALRNVYELVNDDSQIWISTHSIGVIKAAMDLHKENPNKVVFLDLSRIKDDILIPVQVNSEFWANALRIAVDEIASLVMPETIYLCESEGENSLDDKVYSKIFSSTKFNIKFVSVGSSNAVKTFIEEKDKSSFGEFLKKMFSGSDIILKGIIDRDGQTEEQINELKQKGIICLNKGELENYIASEEILTKFFKDKLNNSSPNAEVRKLLQQNDPKNRIGDLLSNLHKNYKGHTYGSDKYNLSLTLTELVTPDTQTYMKLEKRIFGL